MYLSGDGNFHLQLRAGRPSQVASPSFIGDAGFWANHDLFKRYIKATAHIKISAAERVRRPRSRFVQVFANAPFWAMKSLECRTNTHAGNLVRQATTTRLEVTGVYGVSCRHVLFQPGGVVDFSKGEGYNLI